MKKLYWLFLFLVFLPSLAFADRSWTTALLTFDDTSCPANVTTAPESSLCMDLDNGALWACTNPTSGGSPLFCDVGGDWQAITAAGVAGVSSFEGRVGAVTATAGDYTADKITNTPGAGVAATDVQAAINELGGDTGTLTSQMLLKAPLASPIFTGVVTFPSPFTLNATSVTASGTEFNRLVGITSNIQTQIDSKQASLGFTPENFANKNAASGYAGLTLGSKLNLIQLQEVAGLVDLSDVTAKKGNSTTVQMQTGSTATDDCAKFDANGNIVSAGGSCGIPGGGVSSWAGRTGAVVPTTGDYTFGQIGAGTSALSYIIGTGGSISTSGTGTITATTRGAKERAVSRYASLNAAIAAASAGDTILIDADTTVTTSVTATMPLQWVGETKISIPASQILTVTSSPSDWPLRQLFTGVGATPGVSFNGNIGLERVYPNWWGANGQDALDDSNSFNYAEAALQSGGMRGGTFKMTRGKFYLANVLYGPGTTWDGAGVGSTSYEGTTLIQLANSNADVLKTNTAYCPGSSYLHSTQFKNFRILGDTATNTLGNGIHITCATGELNSVENINVSGMPENGILFNGNGTNIRGSHLALHGNGGSGLRIDTTGSAAGLQLVHFDDLSGDNNTISVVYYKPPGSSQVSAFFNHIKAETSAIGKQPDVIVLDNLNGTPVHVEDISALVTGGFTLNSFVRNTSSSTVRLYGKGFRGTGPGIITSLVQDQQAGTTLPYLTNENVFNFTWAGGIAYDIDKGFRYLRNLFNGGTVTVTSSTYTLTSLDENRLTIFNRVGSIAVVLPSAATSGFGAGAIFPFYNMGAGTVTITPNSGTINGAANLALKNGQGGFLVSDGANFSVQITGNAPLDSPIFTGVPTIPSPFNLGATSVTATGVELNRVAGVTSSIQTQLNTKAPSASPTFTGVLSMPSPFTLGGSSVTASAVELNRLVGVTSPIQSQIDTHLADTAAHSATASTIADRIVRRRSDGSMLVKWASYTIGLFPTCNAASKNTRVVVEDGADAGDCSVGGGVTEGTVCRCDGSIWVEDTRGTSGSLNETYLNSGITPEMQSGPNGLLLSGFNSLNRSFRISSGAPNGQVAKWYVTNEGGLIQTLEHPGPLSFKSFPGYPVRILGPNDEVNFQVSSAGVVSGAAQFLHDCKQNFNTDSGDVDLPFDSFSQSVTIKSVKCFYTGAAPATPAVFALEDGSGNALTLAGALVCAAPGGIAVPQAVTAGGTLTANEMLQYDVTNSPNPATRTYLLCVDYVLN